MCNYYSRTYFKKCKAKLPPATLRDTPVTTEQAPPQHSAGKHPKTSCNTTYTNTRRQKLDAYLFSQRQISLISPVALPLLAFPPINMTSANILNDLHRLEEKLKHILQSPDYADMIRSGYDPELSLLDALHAVQQCSRTYTHLKTGKTVSNSRS
ncbi:MAG: hypothetical protein KME23_08055 [Goleter apudmare HA4340-LM2]|jgi:hypothetical protein|nr:hypothetical protein [Goleter apudmare HA4340-LM2]